MDGESGLIVITVEPSFWPPWWAFSTAKLVRLAISIFPSDVPIIPVKPFIDLKLNRFLSRNADGNEDIIFEPMERGRSEISYEYFTMLQKDVLLTDSLVACD
jgi:hypothetical protein